MKKLISMLVVLALVLSFSATAFAAGEKNPADYFAVDGNGNFVIESLAEPVEIFSGNNDVNFAYTAEADGVVTVTPTVDGYAATNIWTCHNDGGWDTTAAPMTVTAGDTVLINIWGGFEGTVTLGDGSEAGGNTGLGDIIEIESYGNAEWTAPQDGYVKFTIDIPGATLAILNGYSLEAEGTDSVTVR